MGVALKDFFYHEGKNRKEAEKALDQIYYQLKAIDAKLKNRMDTEIWKSFQQEQQDIYQIEKNISSILHYK